MPLTAYPGIAPYASWVSQLPNGIAFANGNIWPTPREMTGGDPRSAVNLMAAVEGLTSRTNTLAWHADALNLPEGSTSAYTTTLTTSNVWVYKGNSFVTAGATLQIGAAFLGVGHIVVYNGDITIATGSEILIAAGGVGVQSGTWSKSGNGAWTILRTTIVSSSPVTGFHAEDYDVVILKTGFGVVQLADPAGLPVGIVCRFVIPNSQGGAPFNGSAVSGAIDDHSGIGNHIAVLSAPFTPGASFADVMTVNVGGTMYWVGVGGNGIGD